MRQITAFPRAVREIMTAWIPMRDGVQLAARIWRHVQHYADAKSEVVAEIMARALARQANGELPTYP